ncbi:uncharacterized protein NECHADRAFT_85986 [Fusarium vanettenii 77-13-4]|uniref:Uncharacterized protein n=1 Tax=Fusarium vanettenii (strain ATCC MYA-4622 / CBS 123669 / FGSC 9596 / NRRL 45880 / 77-13-4) TaxID=660122 RepID=C7Z211_FUSV7|nr:uncharacterized protein NECHADRAFT_85986 [Fusarium vanettenii 77-13-4]EEU42092.1 predicted protein [Fusarium vanettenii 77-13-4]
MNDTTLEAPQEVQDSRYEYLDSPIFWVFLFFLIGNFCFQLHYADLSARPKDHPNHTRAHKHTTVDYPEETETTTSAHGGPVDVNSPQTTKTGCCESTTIFKWKPLSPVITSRNIQCLAVVFSSIILLAQLMEGYWIMETLARFTLQGPVDNEPSPIKPFVLLSLILHCLRFLFILLAWAFLIVFGILLVMNQCDFIIAVLETRIEVHHAGCQYAAKTEERVSEDNDSDLERGTYTQLEVIWESPGE